MCFVDLVQIRLWDLSQRNCTRRFQAHEGVTRALTFTPDGTRFLSVGDDKTIKTWDSQKPHVDQIEEPISTIISKVSFS